MNLMMECPVKPIEIKEGNVVLVEGYDDKRFLDSLIKYLGLSGIQTIALGGASNLRPHLDVLKISPEFHKVGTLTMILDSDSDPAGTLQSACAHLSNTGLAVPKKLRSFAPGHPRTCVYLMPRDNMQGMIEDLCLESVAGEPEMVCVDSYFACLKAKGHSYPRNESKAKVQVFLASKEKVLQFGPASEAGYWPWDCTAFKDLRDFLSQVSTGSIP